LAGQANLQEPYQIIFGRALDFRWKRSILVVEADEKPPDTEMRRPEMATSGNEILDRADEAIVRAFNAPRLADTHLNFQIAEGLYRQAGAMWSATWAGKKAKVCGRLMAKAD
jgi:hypothetical protein